jgi:predicted transcriptional regulator of viral defense system
MSLRRTPAAEALYEIAEGQQGLFTAQQATRCGYALGSHAHHVKEGNWLRLHRGIYRLARFPQSEDSQLVLWFLWSRNREGKPQGVYSHQTALSVHELSDAMPAKLHMTVPASFRRNSVIPAVLVLHWADLDKADVEEMRGVRVTKPLKTICALAEEEVVSRDLVMQAAEEGMRRGLFPRAEMRRAANLPQTPAWLAKTLEQSAR